MSRLKVLPNEQSTCLSSAPEMKPCPSLSNVLKVSMKSAKVPLSFSLINSLYTGMNSSNLYAFSPVKGDNFKLYYLYRI